MKKVVMLLPLLCLSGCWQVVNQYDIKDAVEKCGSVEQVAQINSSWDGFETVTCFNAKKVILHRN